MKTPSFITKAFIFCALPCEAKPLIDTYKLKKDNTAQAFSIFRNDDIALTVTGIGKTAMAAGLAYTLGLHSQNTNPVLVNIGIAGHKNHPLGSLFLADKITDNDTSKRYYPPLTFTSPCPTANVITFAKPQQAYPEYALCDMEAAGFYECAMRFTTGELCQSIKIVSDNTEFPAGQIQASKVSELIHANLATINQILTTLRQLAATIPTAYDMGLYQHIVSRYRFSVSEQAQLKKLLTRCRALSCEDKIDVAVANVSSGKAFLIFLQQTLNDAEFIL